VGNRPTRQLSLQPVAIGAVVEVTRRPKPSRQRVTLGDSANTRAATSSERWARRFQLELNEAIAAADLRAGFRRLPGSGRQIGMEEVAELRCGSGDVLGHVIEGDVTGPLHPE
jgi:hypothetical protein